MGAYRKVRPQLLVILPLRHLRTSDRPKDAPNYPSAAVHAAPGRPLSPGIGRLPDRGTCGQSGAVCGLDFDSVYLNVGVWCNGVAVGGRHIGQTPFGVRIVTLASEAGPDSGIAVNGKPAKLRGGCIHHDSGLLGPGRSEPVADRRFRVDRDGLSGRSGDRRQFAGFGEVEARAVVVRGLALVRPWQRSSRVEKAAFGVARPRSARRPGHRLAYLAGILASSASTLTSASSLILSGA